MKSKPTYRDFQEGNSKELMKQYKLNDRGLEQAHRRVLDGAGRKDIESEYKRFYDKNGK